MNDIIKLKLKNKITKKLEKFIYNVRMKNRLVNNKLEPMLLLEEYNKLCNNIENETIDILNKKFVDINNNLYPNLFYKDFQLYVFDSSEILINKTSFNILRKYIKSKDIIITIPKIDIEEINYSEYLFLSDHQIITNFNLNIDRIVKHNMDTIDEDKNFNKLILDDVKLKRYVNKIKNRSLEEFATSDNLGKDNLSIVEFIRNKLYNVKYLVYSDVFIKEMSIPENLISLDLASCNELEKINIEENNTIKSINLKQTKIKYEMLSNFKALENIEGFGDGSSIDIITMKIPSLKKLCLDNIDINMGLPVKTSIISDNLEWLYVKTDNDIIDDIGKLKHLTIHCYKSPKIVCPNLESLEIFSNDFNLSMIEHCTSLKKLILTGNPVHNNTIEMEDLSKFINLEYLEIKKLNILSSSSFSVFTNLKELYLYAKSKYNKKSFEGMTNLTKLHLKFGNLEEDSLKDLINLKELNLNNCFATRCSFSSLELLEDLSIEDCFFKYDISNMFNNLFRLENLVFRDNNILAKQKSFSNLVFLKSLNISCSHLQLFDNLYNLINLTSDKCAVYLFQTSIGDDDFFQNLYSLRKIVMGITEEFDISHLKNITDAHFNWYIKSTSGFYKLHHLKKLHIWCSEIEKDSFKKLTDLTLRTDDIKDDDFEGIDSLEHLDIVTTKRGRPLDDKLIKNIITNNKNLLTFKYNYKYVEVNNHRYCNK